MASRRGRRRLSRSGDFERIYREGSSHANRFVVAYAFEREEADGDPRLGVSVSRKLGGAVDRNAVKRALRDAFWAFADRLPADHDFVLVARPPLAELLDREGPEGVAQSVRETLAKASGIEERLS
jgi:ribonuclease P protein component